MQFPNQSLNQSLMHLPVPEPVTALYEHYLIALVIFLIGIILTRIASRILFVVLTESGIGNALRRLHRNTVRWERHGASIAAFAGYAWALLAALRYLGMLRHALLIAALTVGTILLILAVLKLFSFLPNVRKGKALFRSRQLLLGKMLDLPGIRGKLVRMTATEIHVRTDSGVLRIPYQYLEKVLR